MPRPRPPGLIREPDRHGNVRWYVLHRFEGIGGRATRKRTRIRGEYGSLQFMAAYHAAIKGEAPPDAKGTCTGSVKWLIDRYRDSQAWRDYSLATRRQREVVFRQIIASAGNDAIAGLTRAAIIAGRDRRAQQSPNRGRRFMQTMRCLFAWAVDAQHVTTDPTAGVKDPARRKGGSFKIWTETEVQKYEARWPIGTRQRVWLDLALYSGLRRGDVVQLGRQHARQVTSPDGQRVRVHVIKLQKSGYTVEVTLPILPVLQATLDAGPTGDLTYICGARGSPLKKESFGNFFRDACVEAGVPGRAHGLRKLAATRAANNGATVNELQALFGWTDTTMPGLYTRAADRQRLALGARGKLGIDAPNAPGTSLSAPSGEVRTLEQKVK